MVMVKLWLSIAMGLIKFGVLIFLGYVISYFTGLDWFYSFITLAIFINCVEHIAFDIKDK